MAIYGGGSSGVGTSSNTQVIFNDAGAASGSAGLTFNKSTLALTVGGPLTVSGNILPDGAATRDVGSSVLPYSTVHVRGAIAFDPVSGNGNSLSFTDGAGPKWTDGNVGFSLTHNLQSLSANRTAVWPNANVTVAGANSTAATVPVLSSTAGVYSDSSITVVSNNVGVGLGSVTPPTMFTVGDTSSSSPRGLMSWQASADTNGARLGFRKNRGTFSAPTTIVSGDTVGRLVAWPYDGTGWLEMGSIAFESTGTIATNRTPTQIVFKTATDAAPSVLTTALTLNSDQTATHAKGVTISSGALTLTGATSGTTTIQSPAIAGSATVTMPNASSTLPIYGAQITYTGPTAARTVTYPDANFTVARTDADNSFSAAQTITSGNLTLSGTNAYVIAANNGGFQVSGRTRLTTTTDGIWVMSNNSASDFTRLQFGGTSNSYNAFGRDAVNGFTVQSAAGTATYNDASTAASGTVANRYMFGIAAPTLTATNASVTDTVASTVYIGGAPTASTNTTIGTAYALNVAAGNTNLGGNLTVSGNVAPNANAGGTLGTSSLGWQQVYIDKTITAAGTTTSQTINKASGSVNLAAAATSVVVTNSLVTANSNIQCSVATNDTTTKSVQCVAASGSFTIYPNAAPTSETRINFWIVN